MNDWVNEDDTPYIRMKAERDELIDDLSWYKAKVNRLEDEKDDMLLEREYYKNLYEDMTRRGKEMERENEKLRKANFNGWKQKDKVINKLISNIKSKDNFLSEISQHIGNKPSSSTYKYFRAKLDSIGIKEGE